jgi:hypothetical protein
MKTKSMISVDRPWIILSAIGHFMIMMLSVAILTVGFARSIYADEVLELPDGFHVVEGKHLRLITDKPLDEAIRELPKAFDAAIPQWCLYFNVEPASVEEWRATVFLIGDRPAMIRAGFVTSELPPFKDGFQAGDRLFVVEQPSEYYRRHLVLHEGTHWFMWRSFGGCGSPWFMEGMAEYLATHNWDGNQLKLNVMPADRNEVPYWGRIKIIRAQIQSNSAPTLEQILRYNNAEHRNVQAYAWSWAAVTFFSQHPRYAADFASLMDGRLDYSQQLTNEFRRLLNDRWVTVTEDWQAFLQDLDYGFDFERSIANVIRSTASADREQAANENLIVVHTNMGWQPTSILVAASDQLTVRAQGVAVSPFGESTLRAHPEGVTLEYVNGHPRSALLFAVVPPDLLGASTYWNVQSLGKESKVTVEKGGRIWMKSNAYSNDLERYEGDFQVVIDR